jgi:N-methylhydantoinase A
MSAAMGVDVGGTFTDVVLVDGEGNIHVAKVVTTPSDPRDGVRHGVEVALERAGLGGGDISRFVHGTTLATNVLLERRGARTALAVTEGFGDILRLARESRVGALRYDLLFPPPDPAIERELTFEVHERMTATGAVRVDLEQAEIERVVAAIAAQRPEAVAISFLHSYTNPAHEQAFAFACRRALPDAFVVTSSDVWPEMREYERTTTTIACAYIGPVMATYLAGLQQMLRGLGITCAVQIMESSGGSLSAALAAERPVATIESGGAAGVMAARVVGGWVGARDVLSFDMGGTTAKTAAVRGGEATLTYEFRVGESASVGDRRGAGLPIKTPVVDLAEIGAGGGSIAWVDRGGALQVGPQSAGAVPGPACYGRGGTRPTVTDANLVLGYLRAGELSDGVVLSVDLARDAIRAEVSDRLGVDVVTAARTIHEIVNTNMVAAIRIVTIQRGIDPRDFTLVGFGGAGPIHLARLAAAFGIRQVVVPWAAGVASAIGLVAADPTVTQVRTTVIDATDADPDAINGWFTELEGRAAKALECEPEVITFHRTIDARYPGQVHQLGVPVHAGTLTRADLDDAAERFHGIYHSTYGVDARAPVQFVTYRVRAVREVPTPEPRREAIPASLPAVAMGARPVFFAEHDGFVETPIYRWEDLIPGATIAAPAIVEGAATSIVVPPGWNAAVDSMRNIVLAT